MKHTLHTIAVITFLFSAYFTHAAQEGSYIYTVSNGQATISSFIRSYSGALSITNTLGGCPVTTIGDAAFFSCASLTSVTIPSSVTKVGDFAFYYCTSLTNVTIPASVTTIGTQVFDFCSSLTTIAVDPANVAFSSVDGVLYNKLQTTLIQCPGGKSGNFAIPSTVTTIGDHAFLFCARLTSVTIPSSVTTIGDYVFHLCTSLTNVTISSGVTTIGDWAFDRCTSLTNVTIPSSVTTIGERALAACTSLTTIAVDPANVAFSSLDGVLYNKLQTTLIQCPGGKSGNFAIPSTVTTIGNYAFYYCTSLTSVAIPASVTSIGTMAFRDCTSLQRLYFMGALPTYGSEVFYSAPAILYYLPAYATTWPSTIDDRPTKLWNPAFSEATLLSGSISCTVTGSPPIPIAIEAATNLLSATWLRLQTTNLTSDFLSFDDPDATNYPIRFYRIVGP